MRWVVSDEKNWQDDNVLRATKNSNRNLTKMDRTWKIDFVTLKRATATLTHCHDHAAELMNSRPF